MLNNGYINPIFSRTFADAKGFAKGVSGKQLFKDAKTSEDIQKKIGEKVSEYSDDLQTIDWLADIVVNQGFSARDGISYEFNDLITSSQLQQFIPHVVEIVMKPEVDPQTPISAMLFDEIFTYTGQTIIELGAMSQAVEVDEVAETGEYPIVKPLSWDGGNAVRVTIKKIGIKMGWTSEARDMDQWGILSMYFQKIGGAFARKRENMCIDLLEMHGTCIYDNAFPATSQRGVTTGRGIDGTANGTMSPKDLMWMYAWGQHRGYNPDVLIMHPFAWMMFMTVPQTRELLTSGNSVQNFNIPSINNLNTMGGRLGKLGPDTKMKGQGPFPGPIPGQVPRGLDPYSTLPGVTGTGVSMTPTPFAPPTLGSSIYNHATMNPLAYGVQVQPNFSPAPFRVIVSPWVSFVPITTPAGSPNTKYATNIIMCDSSNIGAIVRKSNITTDGWNDPEHDLEWIRMKEQYGAVIYSQGEAIWTAKNMIVDEQYVFENVNQVSLAEIPNATAHW